MTVKTNLPVWKTVSIGINQKLEEEIKGLDQNFTRATNSYTHLSLFY